MNMNQGYHNHNNNRGGRGGRNDMRGGRGNFTNRTNNNQMGMGGAGGANNGMNMNMGMNPMGVNMMGAFPFNMMPGRNNNFGNFPGGGFNFPNMFPGGGQNNNNNNNNTGNNDWNDQQLAGNKRARHD